MTVSFCCFLIALRYFCTAFMFHVSTLHFVPRFYPFLRFFVVLLLRSMFTIEYVVILSI